LLGVLLVKLLSPDLVSAASVGPATFLVPKHAQWKYFVSGATPPDNWDQLSFNDATWRSGPAGFGYGDDDDQTVLVDMRGRYTSVYIRTTFEIENPDDIGPLYLYVRFDDGFVAYLNGNQVAAASVTRTGGKLRIGLHEAGSYEQFTIEDATRLLTPGRNVLAIEGHNAGAGSSDFSLDPFLAQQKVDVYQEDLKEFERRLLNQSSYLTLRGLDYETALKELRGSISEATRIADFVAGLRKLVMSIGDCHADVSSNAWPVPGWSLPLRSADTAAGVAALAIDRDEPLDPDCPYIESIDGVPLDKWMAVAAQYVPQGSPQLVRRRSLRWLGLVGLLRDELGLPARRTVAIGLRSGDRSKQIKKRRRLTRQRYAVAKVRLRRTRTLDGNIGYVRIAAMDRRLVESTVHHISGFRDTAGMIIDVRNNGGGTYRILRAIYGFFVPNDAKPYVTNIAAYRLSPRFAKNHLAYRPTYRADWDGWSDEERAAIKQAASVFKPEWLPPEGKFSEWHYMVLSRGHSRSLLQRVFGRRRAPEYFHYDKPVVVLCNAGSFSASDGFLSAFADLPQVTLVGEPSAGGSGATRRFKLPNSHIIVALSSMASFRANGKLFDGNGVEVDIHAKPDLRDFTMGTDSVLQRGIAVIKEKGK